MSEKSAVALCVTELYILDKIGFETKFWPKANRIGPIKSFRCPF